MYKLEIAKKLKIESYKNKEIIIPVKKGFYNVDYIEESTLIVLEGLKVINLEWKKIKIKKEKDYILKSKSQFIIIKDSKNNQKISEEWLIDNVEEFYSYKDIFVMEIPVNNEGKLFSYVSYDDHGDIVGIILNGLKEDLFNKDLYQ